MCDIESSELSPEGFQVFVVVHSNLSTLTGNLVKGGGHRDLIQNESVSIVDNVGTFSNGDSFNIETGIYTLASGVPNYFNTPDYIDPADDPSDPKLSLSQALYSDENGLVHKISKALNFKGDPNQISVTTQANGTVSITLSEDLVLSSVQALTMQSDHHTVTGDGVAEGEAALVVNGVANAHAMQLTRAYTQEEIEAGLAPKNALIRIAA